MEEFREAWDLYRPGGLPHVYLGEVYNERYEIVYKLGAGGSAIVFLAKDKASGYVVQVLAWLAKETDRAHGHAANTSPSSSIPPSLILSITQRQY